MPGRKATGRVEDALAMALGLDWNSLAEMLGVKPQTVRQWNVRGSAPHAKVVVMARVLRAQREREQLLVQLGAQAVARHEGTVIVELPTGGVWDEVAPEVLVRLDVMARRVAEALVLADTGERVKFVLDGRVSAILAA